MTDATQINLESGADAVLLIHGLSGNPAEMRYLAHRLYRSGFSVFGPRIPGYGFFLDDPRTSACKWEKWRDAIHAHFERLQSRYRTVSVCGLCIGAVLALDLAAEAGDGVKAVSLLSTTLFYDGWSIPWYRFLLPLGYYTPLRGVYAYREREPFGLKNPKLREWVAREMRNTSSSAAGSAWMSLDRIYQAQRLIRSVKKRLPQVQSPALIVHAREDDVTSLRSADHVARNVGSPIVRRVLLDDSYHMITIDNEKDRVADETIGFLRNHAASPDQAGREEQKSALPLPATRIAVD